LREVGLLRGVLQRNDVALLFAVLRGQLCSGNLRVAQPSERGFVGSAVRCILGRCQQLGNEVIRKDGLLFVQLLQLGLVLFGEVGASVDELTVVELGAVVLHRA